MVEEQPKKELQTELVEDMIAIVTSFAARLYGRRSQRYRVMKTCLAQATETSIKSDESEDLLKVSDQKK